MMQVTEEEKKILLQQKEELQKELQAVKVSVAYIHPSVPYRHVLLPLWLGICVYILILELCVSHMWHDICVF